MTVTYFTPARIEPSHLTYREGGEVVLEHEVFPFVAFEVVPCDLLVAHGPECGDSEGLGFASRQEVQDNAVEVCTASVWRW